MRIGMQDISKSILVKGEVAKSLECNVPFLCCLCSSRETHQNYLRTAILACFIQENKSHASLLLLHNINVSADITSVPVWLQGGAGSGLFNIPFALNAL